MTRARATTVDGYAAPRETHDSQCPDARVQRRETERDRAETHTTHERGLKRANMFYYAAPEAPLLRSHRRGSDGAASRAKKYGSEWHLLNEPRGKCKPLNLAAPRARECGRMV